MLQRNRFSSKSVLESGKILSKTKIDAIRIAQNPERYLENFVEKRIQHVPLDSESMENLIQSFTEEKTQKELERKISDFSEKREMAKSRNFLLLASSSPLLSESLEDSFENEFLNGKNFNTDLHSIIERYLNELRETDTTEIENWINSSSKINELKLPIGFPNDLRFSKKDIDDSSLQTFVEESFDQFLLLDGEYYNKILEMIKKVNLIRGQVLNTKWSLKESALLHYIDSMLKMSRATSATTGLQVQILSRLFPVKSQEDIIEQKYRLKMKKNREDQVESVIRDWERDKNELKNSLNSAWGELNKNRMKIIERNIQIKQQRELCFYWSNLLNKLRVEKCEKIKATKLDSELFEQRKMAQELSRNKREIQHRKLIKERVDSYKKMREEKKIEEIRENQKLCKEFERVLKLQSIKNRERSNFRQKQFEEKKQAQKEKELAEKEEKARKAEALEKTKEKVDIFYEPGNALHDTFATRVRAEEILSRQWSLSEEEEMVKFFNERYSFSDETHWKDRRARLQTKLREAGLHHSSYGRQVLLAMEPASKPHLNSQIKLCEEK